MKSQNAPIKRLLSFVLTVVMLLSVCAICTMPTSALSGYPKSVQNGTGSRGPIQVSDSYGYRVNILCEFTAFGFAMPTWATNNSACRLSLYAWQGSFKETVAGEPIATQVFDPMVDNHTNVVEFDAQPAGEYLFLVSEPHGQVGVWANTGVSNSLGFAYADGIEGQGSQPELKIMVEEDLAQPFGPCEASVPPIDGNHTPPEEYVLPEDSLIYTHEVMPDTWVFTDGLGRVSLTNAEVGDPRDDRTLAMFYWTWHASQGASVKPFNNQEFLSEHPEALNDYNHPGWPTGGVQHFWNQPIYGYYKTNDTWVLRRQAEMLANAGVDTIFTDNTNGTFTWRNSYQPLFKTWSQAMDDGVLTPKVSFMLPFSASEDAKSQLKDMYLDFYREGEYHKLWFYWEGKPMLMAYNSMLSSSENIEKEIKNFFTFRSNYAGYINHSPAMRAWGWLSVYPQTAYWGTTANRKAGQYEQISVGVAVNHNYVLRQLSAMNGENIIGRSYTSDYPDRYQKEGDSASLWGYNFAEQFGYALEKDPQVIFVTGWNEWIAGRYKVWPEGSAAAVNNAFPDECNDEFSRDLEPSRGALKDHYYYQLVNFVRQYKGCRPIPTPTTAVTIDMNGGAAQWENVGPYYASYIGNTGDRDAEGYATCYYVDYSGRNDIIGARVARDEENVYFYVECNDTITPYTDPLWMVLYIDCDQENRGWESFDYVINKTSPTATTAVLEKFADGSYESTKVADVTYTVDGKTMQICVPKSALGLAGYDFTINFSWTDNVHDEADQAEPGQTDYVYTAFSGDILDFYTSGDVAPGGRFKFSYVSNEENAGVKQPEETTTEAETKVPVETTEAETTETESAETEAPIETTEPETTEPETTAPETTAPETTEASVTTEPDATTAETTAETTAGDATTEVGSGCASALGSTSLILVALITLCGTGVSRKRR